MDVLSALILGLLQGITEFLPVSSSGHLVIAESWLKLDVESLKGFDIAVHLGSLLAIFIYFRADFLFLLRSLWHFALRKTGLHRGGRTVELETGIKMCGYLTLGTVPAVFVGLFFNDFLDAYFRSPFWAAFFMIIVGVLFFAAEYAAVRVKPAEIDLKNTALIGVAQAIALLPGVSRSGATISCGLALGLKREQSARFSFLLGSVAITAATAWAAYKSLKGEMALPSVDLLLTGVIASSFSGYAAIAFLMRFLKKHTLHVFGVYLALLGFAVLFNVWG